MAKPKTIFAPPTSEIAVKIHAIADKILRSLEPLLDAYPDPLAAQQHLAIACLKIAGTMMAHVQQSGITVAGGQRLTTDDIMEMATNNFLMAYDETREQL